MQVSTPLLESKVDDWIFKLGTIGKNAQNQTRAIITKHSCISAKKTITCFYNLIHEKPKKDNRAIFYNIDNSIINSLLNRNNNILTHSTHISNKKFM